MNARRTVMELILSNHPAECLTCSSNGHCELQKIAHDLGIREIRYKGEMSTFTIDRSPSIVRNMNKCIMCRRCETMCNTIQTVGALTAVNRGFNAAVSTAFERDMAGSTCSYCGQCVSVCPVNALSGHNTQQPVLDALADPTKIVIARQRRRFAQRWDVISGMSRVHWLQARWFQLCVNWVLIMYSIRTLPPT